MLLGAPSIRDSRVHVRSPLGAIVRRQFVATLLAAGGLAACSAADDSSPNGSPACTGDKCTDGGMVDVQDIDSGAEPDADEVPGPLYSEGLRIGLWISPWKLTERTPSEWVHGIKGLSYASSHPNKPIVIIAMCGANAGNTSKCQFPEPDDAPNDPNIVYRSTDVITPIMNAVEEEGDIEVILDVEPMNAKVSNLMNVVMNKYGHYKSVVGFAPDWEWVRGDEDKTSLVPAWLAELHEYRPGMEMHLIGWKSDIFGTFRDDPLSYGFDGQDFDDLEMQLAYFEGWQNDFEPNRTAVYWAYNKDVTWTRKLVGSADAIRDLHDEYRSLNKNGTIFMATEDLFFEIDDMLPDKPMWD